MRIRLLLAVAALALLPGCGGGAGGGSGPAPSASKSEARFDVDLKTGKVTITPAGGRAVFQGGAVSFTSSDLLSLSGDSGQRLIRIAARNNSGQAWGPSPVRLTVSSLANADAAALRANVAVATYAGTGASAGADAYRTSAAIGSPSGVCQGRGPLAGSLIVAADSTIRRIDAGGTVTTLAGVYGAAGFADGTGSGARFSSPHDVACDASGNIFVSDYGNHRIRRITPLGTVSTIAGTGDIGAARGLGSVASFATPWGIAVSPSGDRIYVADSEGQTIRLVRYRGVTVARELPTSYTVDTIAGTEFMPGMSNGDNGAPIKFRWPNHLALMIDATGAETLFVADSYNGNVRRIALPADEVPIVSTVAGDGFWGDTDGPGSVARLQHPIGIAGEWLDASSFVLFVTDTAHVRSITFAAGGSPTQEGSYSVLTLAGAATSGFVDGDGNTSRFSGAAGLTAVGTGSGATLYLADQANNRIRRVNVPGGALHSGGSGTAVTEPVRVANADAELPNRTAWSKTLTADSGAWTADLQFYVPNGVSGFSFLATIETDTTMANLPAEGASFVSTLAGGYTASFTDGPGKQALLSGPQRVVAVPVAMRGLYRSPSIGGAPIRAFITDWGNNRVRFIDINGYVGVWAGSSAGVADGVGAAAQFQSLVGADLAPDGSLIVTDANRIRRVWPNQQVTTVAGTGAQGSTDGPGGAATFGGPRGVAVTAGWRIYIADTDNNTIRRITLTGSDPRSSSSYTVSTVAGLAGSAGYADGAGIIARFSRPLGMASDTDGRIYIADSSNNAIRTLTPAFDATVQITTLAAGQSGPSCVAVDSVHNVFVCRDLSWSIARIGPTGVAVTLAGGGSQGLVDGAPGALFGPVGLSLEETGTILFADYHAVRALSRIVDAAAL